jgi:hypothetical protein
MGLLGLMFRVKTVLLLGSETMYWPSIVCCRTGILSVHVRCTYCLLCDVYLIAFALYMQPCILVYCIAYNKMLSIPPSLSYLMETAAFVLHCFLFTIHCV